MTRLRLVPIGEHRGVFLEALGEGLSRALPMEFVQDAEPLDPASAYDPVREQFLSSRLLEMLAERAAERHGDRVLGVIDADLFVPILTFVFGEAQLGGRAAVFSTTRLQPTFYGLPRDRTLLLERSLKEALHEVGHTIGLVHCHDAACVMRASTNAEEVDLKPARFCGSCSHALVAGCRTDAAI